MFRGWSGWPSSSILAVHAALAAAALCAGSALAQNAPPDGANVQRAQDHCPNGPDCAAALREPAPKPVTPEPKPAAHGEEPGKPLIGFGSPALAAPGGLAGAAEGPKHPLSLSAYFILGGQWLQSNGASTLIGKNNGFKIGDARLEITGRPAEKFWLYLSFDGAVEQASASDPTKGSRTVALKDAYGVFSPGYHLRVQAGQFKAPQDVEALIEETEIKFPSRSIVTDGVHAPAGWETGGLSLGRQVGLALGTDAIALPFGTIAAQVALTNGNGANALFNDTTAPAVAGRLAVGVLGMLSLGVDGYYLSRGYGTAPIQYDDIMGFGADLRAQIGPFHAMGLVQSRTTKHTTLGSADETSLGWSAEAAVLLFGFLEPALRYSVLDPSDKLPVQKVSELSAALNLYSFGAVGQGVARLSLAYTHRGEEAGKQIANDGVDLAAQLRF